MPKYGKSREHDKRNKKPLTQARSGGRRAAGVRELPWDVLEYVLPLLPARALLRARAVCRCGLGFTWDSVAKLHASVGRLNYRRNPIRVTLFLPKKKPYCGLLYPSLPLNIL